MVELENEFGHYIRKLRELRKWSQAEVAEKLGVDRVTYTNIENGKHRIGLQLLSDIAQTFGGISIDEFFKHFRAQNRRAMKEASPGTQLEIAAILEKIRSA